MSVLSSEEMGVVFESIQSGKDDPWWLRYGRSCERAVIAKLTVGVEMPEPVGYRNPFHTYSLMTADQIKKNEFQYSDEFLLRHTEPLYTADQLQAYGAAVRLQALEDAVNVVLNFQAGWVPDGFTECADKIRALKGGA